MSIEKRKEKTKDDAHEWVAIISNLHDSRGAEGAEWSEHLCDGIGAVHRDLGPFLTHHA